MGGMELALGKIIEPFPGLSTVATDIGAGDCGENFAIRPERIDLDAIGANVGADFVFTAMQKKSRVGDAGDSIGADGVIDPPARSNVNASDDAHAVDGGVGTDSGNEGPFAGAEVQVVSLIAGPHVERAGMRLLRVIELHGEDIKVGWEMGERAVFDP